MKKKKKKSAPVAGKRHTYMKVVKKEGSEELLYMQ
jgi:hypothetical protein